MKIRALTFSCFLIVALAACGSDSTSSGIYQDGSTGVNLDGSTGGDTGGTDAGGPVEDCGNGVCDPGENVFSCRDDCDSPETLKCAATPCGDQVGTCKDAAGCGDAVLCVWACTAGDSTCVDACKAGLDAASLAALDALTGCAATAGCTVDPGQSCAGRCGEVGGGGKCGCDTDCAVFGDCCDDYAAQCQPSCGDGVCAQGEDCPADCIVDDCGNGSCDEGESNQNCPQDCPLVSDCGNGTCNEGETPESCPADCPPVGDCGNGECGDGETPINCPQDCGGGGPECGDGTCDPGEDSDNCPDDCPAGGECGDGLCNNGETIDTCPADCLIEPKTEFAQCAADNCPSELAACLADASCAPIVDCANDCPEGDMDCLQGCLTSGGFSQAAMSMGYCIYQSNCLDGGGQQPPPPPANCGDGTCDPDENPQNCPQDCSGGGEGCGDGVCDESTYEQYWCQQDCP